MRSLTIGERKALLALASEVRSDAERVQLIYDLTHCVVEDLLPNAEKIMFHVDGYERPDYRGQDTFQGRDRFPVEGALTDFDGAEVDVCLYCDQNKRILELELIKHSVDALVAANWDSFRVK